MCFGEEACIIYVNSVFFYRALFTKPLVGCPNACFYLQCSKRPSVGPRCKNKKIKQYLVRNRNVLAVACLLNDSYMSVIQVVQVNRQTE